MPKYCSCFFFVFFLSSSDGSVVMLTRPGLFDRLNFIVCLPNFSHNTLFVSSVYASVSLLFMRKSRFGVRRKTQKLFFVTSTQSSFRLAPCFLFVSFFLFPLSFFVVLLHKSSSWSYAGEGGGGGVTLNSSLSFSVVFKFLIIGISREHFSRAINPGLTSFTNEITPADNKLVL